MRVNKWIIIVGAIIIIWIPAFFTTANLRDAQLSACNRGNVARQSELDQRQALIDVNIERVKAASPGPERQANRYALQRYRENKKDLILSQAQVAEEEGSVIVDCGKAYPKPFPFNLF
jgi:hypothetical protein